MISPVRRKAVRAAHRLLSAGVRPSRSDPAAITSCSNDRRYSTRKPPVRGQESGPRYNFNTSLSWETEPDPDHPRYRRVTARDLKHRDEPPTRVKMLVRDFIDDSLYNPNYGYFSKQAQIFSPSPSRTLPSTSRPSQATATPTSPASSTSSTNLTSPTPPPLSSADQGFPITSFPNLTAFQEHVAEAYVREYAVEPPMPAVKRRGASFANKASDVEGDEGQQGEIAVAKGEGWSSRDQGGRGGVVVPGGLGRQVWHTPTELFKPHYSRIIARALLSHYKLHHYPHNPFHLYELGAGNGSLMIDIMTFLKEEHPEIFAMTRYTIVEISGQLAERQRMRARDAGFLVEDGKKQGNGAKQERKGGTVEVINKDWFEWEGRGDESCYLVALEVLDNFAHDMIRYDLRTMDPLQAVVCIDAYGDFSLLYEPITDPIIRRYLAYRHLLHRSSNASIFTSSSASPPINPLLLSSPTLRRLYASLPFAPNLSDSEFVPTKQMLFLESLRDKLPNHRLLLADFDSLPDTVPGRNGPVVQTRYGGSMVPCETFLVKQGFFDIFFPTDFKLLRDIYFSIMTTSPRQIPSSFFSSATALRRNDASSRHLGVKGFKHQNVSLYTHSRFLETFGTDKDIEATRTRDGGNVMLGMYKNAKFMF